MNTDKPQTETNTMLGAGRAHMNLPHRIQRKRVKGWKNPPNTVYVGRPTKWGNPFKVGTNAQQFSIALLSHVNTIDQAVSCYQYYIKLKMVFMPNLLKELKGKNLSCFCPLDKHCHADVLIRLANG